MRIVKKYIIKQNKNNNWTGINLQIITTDIAVKFFMINID